MNDLPENISHIQEKRGSRFKKGQSGNPKGKPRGTLNKANRLVLDLIAADAGPLVEKLKFRALEKGDVAALKILLDRISPPRRDAPTPFEMPPIKTMQDAIDAQSKVLEQVAAGELTAAEGNAISAMIDNISTAARMEEMLKRLEAVEQSQGQGRFRAA